MAKDDYKKAALVVGGLLTIAAGVAHIWPIPLAGLIGFSFGGFVTVQQLAGISAIGIGAIGTAMTLGIKKD